MYLQRRLRPQHHARARSHVNRLTQIVTAEHARPGADDEHVGRIVDGNDRSDAKRRLRIAAREHRAVAAPRERQLEAAGDSSSNSRCIHAMTSCTPVPFLMLVKTNGRSPRIFFESRAMTSRSAPTCGARSILLMTSRSDRVTPGPPLRGILSPPETSIT